MSSAPRVRGAALITTDEGVVLVRHRSGDSTYHLLPGGGVDYRETLAECVAREVREETGLEIALGDPVIVSDTIDPTGTRHVVNIVFRATVTGGSLTDAPLDARVEAVDIVPPDRLQDLDLRPPFASTILDVLARPDGPARYLGALFAPDRAKRT